MAAAVERLQENFETILEELKRSLPEYNSALSLEESAALWGNKNSADLVDRGEWMMLYVLRTRARACCCCCCWLLLAAAAAALCVW